jgi:glycosyltransferase involved in cell wall biosynthesis
LKRYKGLELVVDAVGQLAREGIGVRLIVAGKGDHAQALQRHAAYGAPGRVEFRGYVSEEQKIELLRKAWATVYPSPKEGWGITNVESAACGTSVVASDSPGLRESVADGVSGLLVEHGEVAAWAAALRRIAQDAPLRERLYAGALGFAARFSWDRTADETEAHLLEVAGGRPAGGRERVHEPLREAK